MPIDRAELIRFLLKRLATHTESAEVYDFPRLEELAYMLLAVLYGKPEQFSVDLDRPITLSEILREWGGR